MVKNLWIQVVYQLLLRWHNKTSLTIYYDPKTFSMRDTLACRPRSIKGPVFARPLLLYQLIAGSFILGYWVPRDLYLMAYRWKGSFYIDWVLTMGLRSAAFLCQIYTNAMALIGRKRHLNLVNYWDNFARADRWKRAYQAFAELCSLFQIWALWSCPRELVPQTNAWCS